MSSKQVHFKVVKFIFKCAEKLHLKDLVVASACTLYHDFFKNASVETYDPYTVATTAIYNSTKLEEQTTRLRDVVNVCHRTLHPNVSLELDSSFWAFRDSIAAFELLMLRNLKFDVAYVHPHKFLLHYLLSISQLFPTEEDWRCSNVTNVSWALLKDSYLNSACFKHSPNIFSIAIIHLALQCCHTTVPLSEHAETPWWKVLYEDCTLDKITDAQSDIVSTYDGEEI